MEQRRTRTEREEKIKKEETHLHSPNDLFSSLVYFFGAMSFSLETFFNQKVVQTHSTLEQ